MVKNDFKGSMSWEEFRNLGIAYPRNWSHLSSEDKIKWEEWAYHVLLICRWGFLPGDPRLKSGDRIKELDGV